MNTVKRNIGDIDLDHTERCRSKFLKIGNQAPARSFTSHEGRILCDSDGKGGVSLAADSLSSHPSGNFTHSVSESEAEVATLDRDVGETKKRPTGATPVPSLVFLLSKEDLEFIRELRECAYFAERSLSTEPSPVSLLCLVDPSTDRQSPWLNLGVSLTIERPGNVPGKATDDLSILSFTLTDLKSSGVPMSLLMTDPSLAHLRFSRKKKKRAAMLLRDCSVFLSLVNEIGSLLALAPSCGILNSAFSLLHFLPDIPINRAIAGTLTIYKMKLKGKRYRGCNQDSPKLSKDDVTERAASLIAKLYTFHIHISNFEKSLGSKGFLNVLVTSLYQISRTTFSHLDLAVSGLLAVFIDHLITCAYK